MRAKIEVFLKEGVLDPQGETIKRALYTLGYSSIKDVRQGKVFYIELKDKNPQGILEEIARKVLANPVIEDFRWEVER